MKVLVACEFSGRVRDAFRIKGVDAWSCDLLKSEGDNRYHIQANVLNCLNESWDMMIAFVPCTHLAVSGARWFKEKQKEQQEAIAFFMKIINAPIPRIAIENPIGIMSTYYRKPDQIIQPWQFGHTETKSTCLWLKRLPKLNPTHDVFDLMEKLPENKQHRVHYESPGPNRWKNRSRTLPGIAQAMAEQWGGELRSKQGEP